MRHETLAVESILSQSILSQYDIRFTRCHYGNEFYTSLYRKKDGRFKEWLLGRFCDFFFPINPHLHLRGVSFKVSLRKGFKVSFVVSFKLP